MLYVFFWVILQCLNFICWRFRTHCLFHLHRRVGMKNSSHLPAYEGGTDIVKKRRHIKFRRRGITQKKTYHKILVGKLKRKILFGRPRHEQKCSGKTDHRKLGVTIWSGLSRLRTVSNLMYVVIMSLVSESSMACLHQLHFNYSGMTAPANEWIQYSR